MRLTAAPQLRHPSPGVSSRMRCGQGLQMAIGSSQYPYEVNQAEFQEAEAIPEGGILRDGTIWTVQLAWPGTGTDHKTEDLLLVWPLEAYAEAIRPHYDELRFVETYILAWRNASQDVFAIDKHLMERYLSGELTTLELGDEMVITGI